MTAKPTRWTVSNATQSFTLTAAHIRHAVIKALSCGLRNVGTITVRKVEDE